MKLKTGYENRRARVEMLPLIDVVFLLLVFFIYAMVSMVVHHGLKVDLPEAGKTEMNDRDYLSITITAENRILFDEEETSVDNLAELVRNARAERGATTPIFINGDRTADLGIAVAILDAFQKAGIEHISFSCKKEELP